MEELKFEQNVLIELVNKGVIDESIMEETLELLRNKKEKDAIVA